MSNHECFLKIKDGRFVAVRNDMKMNLCAVETQNAEQNGQRVHIKETPKTPKTQMAFLFKRGNFYYLPKVEGGTLTLQEADKLDVPINDHHRFEKVNLTGSEHYGLRSVVEPSLYVCGPSDADPYVFFLSTNNEQCVLVKNEEI